MRWILVTISLVSIASGCTHQQLRYNTTHQADTLNDIYRRQVLDNLAMFVDNPYAVPHFAFPNQGSSNVVDSGSFNGPLDDFRAMLKFNAGRNMTEAWTLDPVRDPGKLKRMRCAYQRAVGVCNDPCNDCCKIEKAFYGAGSKKIQVLKEKVNTKETANEYCCRDKIGEQPECPQEGVKVNCITWVPVRNSDGTLPTDPLTGIPFVNEDGSCNVNPQTGDFYEIKLSKIDGKNVGCLSIPAYDCNGPCAIQCGWYGVGGKTDVPLDCLCYSGHYHGTYVWVLPEYRHHLANLVLTVLEYATKDPASRRTKQVELYVDATGNTTTKRAAHAKVTATIPIGEPNASILNVRDCSPKGTLPTKSEFTPKISHSMIDDTRLTAEVEIFDEGVKRSDKKLEELRNDKETLTENFRKSNDQDKTQYLKNLNVLESNILEEERNNLQQHLKLQAARLNLLKRQRELDHLEAAQKDAPTEPPPPPSPIPPQSVDRVFGPTILQERLYLDALTPR